MNYHIITQEKFFHAYIEDIYRIHEEDNNVIWVRGTEGKNDFFQTDRPVEYIGTDAAYIRKKLSQLKPEDKLFVSWYDTFIGDIILSMGLPNPLYVYLLGAEFYSFPYWWHAERMFDPLTKRKVKQLRLYPRFFPKGKPWLWYRAKNWWKFKREVEEEYLAKLETIKRIDYIVITEHSGPEVELVKQLYPGCKAKHAVNCFDQNFDIAKTLPMKPLPKEDEPIKILFGNSSDPNGNHMDAIRYLERKIKTPFEVYSFLSYGDPESKEWTIEYAKKHLGDRFHAVTDYMDRPSFVQFVQQMDVVMMFHNRQQAEGNIMTALSLGKPVFMKTKNPQFDMLKRMGVKSVYDVLEMHTVDLRKAIVEAQAHREETMHAIDMEYSDETRLRNLKKLLNQ
jgi:glycosyltransferase involved in cell wall biosynthesis